MSINSELDAAGLGRCPGRGRDGKKGIRILNLRKSDESQQSD